MDAPLPGGGRSAATNKVDLAKVALSLAGQAHLANSISILTGMRRTTVRSVARKALAGMDTVRGLEFRELGSQDREWADATLVRAYETLASTAEAPMLSQALRGAESLNQLIFSVGISSADKRELKRVSEDVRLYFNKISHAMAILVSGWYHKDPSAAALATATTVGQIYNEIKVASSRLSEIEAKTFNSTPLDTPSSTAGLLIERAKAVLDAPPDYYPAAFTNRSLAKNLEVVEIDDRQFFQFKSAGLYWGGRLHGTRKHLTVADLNHGTLTVLLGDPGSGKSTLAKGLVLSELHREKLSVYCRLDDLTAASSCGCISGGQ